MADARCAVDGDGPRAGQEGEKVRESETRQVSKAEKGPRPWFWDAKDTEQGSRLDNDSCAGFPRPMHPICQRRMALLSRNPKFPGLSPMTTWLWLRCFIVAVGSWVDVVWLIVARLEMEISPRVRVVGIRPVHNVRCFEAAASW